MNPLRLCSGVLCVAGVVTAATASAQVASTAKPVPPQPAQVLKGGALRTDLMGFSVVLALAEMQGNSVAADNVPAAARKALADMKDFLPYKTYRLLDTAWIAGSSRATTRLRGPDDADYEVTVDANPISPMRVFFWLREVATEPTPASIGESAMLVPRKAEAEERIAQLEKEIAELRKTYSERQPAVVGKSGELAEMKKKLETINHEIHPKKAGALINTTFNMEVGETVVVGTSRLKGGDKALIALLTAVPRGAKRE